MKYNYFTFLIWVLVLSSCASKKDGTPFKMRIHDIWYVRSISDLPIQRQQGQAYIEFNTTEKKIYGNDGCNEFSGTLKKLTNTSIKLEPLPATKMICPDRSLANSFHTALKNVHNYRFEDLFLILLDKNGNEILRLIKGD